MVRSAPLGSSGTWKERDSRTQVNYENKRYVKSGLLLNVHGLWKAQDQRRFRRTIKYVHVSIQNKRI